MKKTIKRGKDIRNTDTKGLSLELVEEMIEENALLVENILEYQTSETIEQSLERQKLLHKQLMGLGEYIDASFGVYNEHAIYPVEDSFLDEKSKAFHQRQVREANLRKRIELRDKMILEEQMYGCHEKTKYVDYEQERKEAEETKKFQATCPSPLGGLVVNPQHYQSHHSQADPSAKPTPSLSGCVPLLPIPNKIGIASKVPVYPQNMMSGLMCGLSSSSGSKIPLYPMMISPSSTTKLITSLSKKQKPVTSTRWKKKEIESLKKAVAEFGRENIVQLEKKVTTKTSLQIKNYIKNHADLFHIPRMA